MISQLQTKYKISHKYNKTIDVNSMLWNDIFNSVPQNFVQLIVIYCTYPRLDVNVSKDSKHLLKLPFSVHPTSKKLSVPIDIQNIDNFSPSTCISLYDLIENVEKFEQEIQRYIKCAEATLNKTNKSNLVVQQDASLIFPDHDP